MKEDITKQHFTKFQGSVPTRRVGKINELFLPQGELFFTPFWYKKSSLFFNILSILENFKFLPTFIKVVYFDPLVASNFKYCIIDQLFVPGLIDDF